MWKRKVLEYAYHESRNENGKLLPINSEEVSEKIVETFKRYGT